MPRHTHTFTIRVMGPDIREEQPASEVDAEYREVEEILKGRVLGDAEDIINDALPDEWYAKVESRLRTVLEIYADPDTWNCVKSPESTSAWEKVRGHPTPWVDARRAMESTL